jgi:hypothetical protein
MAYQTGDSVQTGPKTPPRTLKINSDTPVHPHRTISGAYHSNVLNRNREAVLSDLSRVIEIPIGKLLDILPSHNLSQNRVDKIKQLHITNGRWALWPKDPAECELHEDETFKAFATLVANLISSCEVVEPALRTPTVSLEHNPRSTPYSNRSSKSIPDGYFVLHKSVLRVDRQTRAAKDPSYLRPFAALLVKTGKEVLDQTIHWPDIAIPTEYKKREDRDSIENVSNC